VKVRVRYAQVALVDQHRQQGGHRGVAKGFVNSEQEQGRQDHCGVDVVGENRCGQQKQNHHSDQPPKIIKTALWVNCQVAGWCAEAGSSREHRPVDARIVSAHNNGNPYSFAEAVAQEL